MRSRDAPRCAPPCSHLPAVRRSLTVAADAATYELPDGNTVDVSGLRFAVPELLFQPHPLNVRLRLLTPLPLPAAVAHARCCWRHRRPQIPGAQPLHNMTHHSVLGCDPDLRRDMLGNVLLAGAGSLVRGLPQRLTRELTAMVPAVCACAFPPHALPPRRPLTRLALTRTVG